MKTAFLTLSEKVKKEILSEKLTENGDKVLVAFSGGADSTALLLTLYGLENELGIKVFAAHLNHGIRGAEADRDENFCRLLCAGKGIPFVSGHVSVPDEAAKTGEGIEECARRLRYGFLFDEAENQGCNRIATAHHADDNIETVLLHLTRGTGLRGLCGIPSERGKIIRPLLSIGRSEITEALESIGQTFVTDSTNGDDGLSRNLLRHEVLPELYKINPGADKAFLSMCRSVAEDEKFLSAESMKIPDDADMKTLKTYPRALVSRFVKRKYENFFGEETSRQLGYEHVRIICDFIENGNGTVKYTLPGNVCAYLGAFGLMIKSKDKTESPDYVFGLCEGENDFSSYGYRIFTTFDKNVAKELKNIYKLSIPASVNSDKINHIGLAVRNRKTGDEYVFGGFLRSVSRQLVKYKVPEFVRKDLPVVTDGNGNIIWVPGLPVADSVKPEKDGKITYIIYCPER